MVPVVAAAGTDPARDASPTSRMRPSPVSSPTGRAPDRQNLAPLYWAGLCDAVNMTPGAPIEPEAK